jgi:hypothetical protein
MYCSFNIERLESDFQTLHIDPKELRRRFIGNELRVDAWAPHFPPP